MKKSDLKVGDRVKVNFNKATENSKNQLYISNLEQQIEDTIKLGTGYFVVDQITESFQIWLVAEDLDIGDIAVKREALRKKK